MKWCHKPSVVIKRGQDMQEKILVGHKLRRFRQSIGLSQTAMSEALDISPSYLNLLEHNQRPLTVTLLLKLGNSFDIDLKSFAEDDSQSLIADMSEIFTDPLFTGEAVSRRELQDLISAAPGAARSVIKLFHAYHKVRDELQSSDHVAGREARLSSPIEVVRDVLQSENNYFASVEQAATDLLQTAGLAEWAKGKPSPNAMSSQTDRIYSQLVDYVEKTMRLRVRIMPAEIMGSQLRRYDLHRREIMLSEALRRPQRQFHLLVQIALLTQQDLLQQMCDDYKLPEPQSQSLFRITLAGYFAAAVMMPYTPFLESAKSLRYDIDLLGRRFGCSFEQVCHRLTSLNAPAARGVPFFFIRVDDAGNISKRLAAGGMQFAKFGGTCPKWAVHKAFRTPERMLLQAVELPQGQKFFTIARTVPSLWTPVGESAPEFAIALGCEMHHTRDLVYADHLDTGKNLRPEPIGVGCAVCERMECGQRAHPPIGHDLQFDGHMRRVGLYDLGMK